MKSQMTLIAAFLFFATATFANVETFAAAQAAYDDGRYAEASMLYEELLGQGIGNVEVQ